MRLCIGCTRDNLKEERKVASFLAMTNNYGKDNSTNTGSNRSGSHWHDDI